MSGAPTERDRFEVLVAGRDRPEISVLMPVFQQERFVGDAIRSVLAQREVVVEVIVSDDASTDGTWTAAVEAIEVAPSHPHRVIVRHNATRLRRNHTVLLAEHATAAVVMAAHGDDITEPRRARRVLDVLGASGAALTGSAYRQIDGTGAVTMSSFRPRADVATGDLIGPAAMVQWSDEFVGSMHAWRPSAMAGFDRLDGQFAAVAHDSVLPFRAALAGGATLVTEPLVRRRVHQQAWSRAVWDQRRPEAGRFGYAVSRLSAARAMRADLQRARELGLVTPSDAEGAERALAAEEALRHERLVEAHDSLVRAGFVPMWATEEEVGLAREGRLLDVLRDRARWLRPVEAVIARTRRIRRHVRRPPVS